MALWLLSSRSQDEHGHGADILSAVARHLPEATAHSRRAEADGSQWIPRLSVRGLQPGSPGLRWQPEGLL